MMNECDSCGCDLIDGRCQNPEEVCLALSIARTLDEEVSRSDEKIEKLKAAALLAIEDWQRVTKPGAACEGCQDPPHIAALREAIKDAE